jgi:hypothetical protein
VAWGALYVAGRRSCANSSGVRPTHMEYVLTEMCGLQMKTAGIPTELVRPDKTPTWVYPRIRQAGNEKPVPWSTKAHDEMSDEERRAVYVSETHR